ncbi:hypothetical protein Btru_062820 [Bulinus truncatus]|nr:hypothetical protein Btru_062820 [Bulinus truncatus]
MDQRDVKGRTALMIAVQRNDLSRCQFLLEHGADPNIRRSIYGEFTALSLASKKWDPSFIRVLVKYGAHFACEDGDVALVKAVGCNFFDIIRMGERILFQKKRFNFDPAVIVAFNTRKDIVDTLLRHRLSLEISLLRTDSLDLIRRLISAGVKVNFADDKGQTALIKAVLGEHIETVKLLLQSRAYTEVADNDGNKSLHLAVKSGNVEVVKLLVERKANLEAIDKDGETALLLATSTEMLTYLVSCGCNVNTSNKKGETPLTRVTWQRSVDDVKLLIEKGADLNKVDECGSGVLFNSIVMDKYDIVDFLLEKDINVNTIVANYNSPLMQAIEKENEDLVKKLISKGADVNLQYGDKGSFLIGTILKHVRYKSVTYSAPDERCQKLLNIIVALIDAGANLDSVDSLNRTALMIVLEEEKRELVKLLVEKKANPNVRNKENLTLLMVAIDKYDVETVKLLISSGANVDDTDSNENTALVRAIERIGNHKTQVYYTYRVISNMINDTSKDSQCLEIVKILVNSAANVNITNNNKNNALVIALGNTQAEDNIVHCDVQLLFTQKADANVRNIDNLTALMLVIKRSDYKMASMLIKAGANVNDKDDKGNSILIMTIKKLVKIEAESISVYGGLDSFSTNLFLKLQSSMDIIYYLLTSGANVNAVNSYNDSALNIALDSGKFYLVRILMGKGADGNIYGCKKKPPLLHLSEDYGMDLVVDMVKSGVNVHVTDEEGNIALMKILNRFRYYDQTEYGLSHAECLKAVKVLTEYGADVNLTNIHDQCPLLMALSTHSKDIVWHLIQTGADRKQIFRALLNAYADILKTDEQGNDALHYAAMCENKQFLCYIINKYWTSEHTESDEPGPSKPKRMKLNLDINRTNKNQETALFKAAAFGRTNNVKILIKYGCDVFTTLDEQTALLKAVSKADANIDLENCFENSFGGNLLHYVPDMTIAKYLVENKIDINQRDQLGRSPLYMAIKRRKTDLVHFLLNKGANVNAVTSTSNTALMLATKLQNLELVTTLLTAGADINIQNRLGWTALFIAARKMSLCNVNDKSLAVFEQLFLLKANLDLQDNLGRTLLMLLVEIKDFNKIATRKQYSFKGKHMNFKDKKGMRVLVRTLLRKNADPDQIELILIYGAYPVLTKRGKHILMDWIQAHYNKDYYFIYGNPRFLRLCISNGLTFHLTLGYTSSVKSLSILERARIPISLTFLIRMGQIQSVRYLIANCCIGKEEFHSICGTVCGSRQGAFLKKHKFMAFS